ncbi:MAG: FAD-dependent oxidoreductase [Mycoplasmataceae bacterium]|jgi:thioredoxin reductase (NADPH)|nr:FAD-dependent oxidoreductase [Mycoplasmataceae bacterium]
MPLETLTQSDSNTFDILIIGGGPAALTAAIYGRYANMKVGFVEKDVPGGKIVNIPKIINYPGFSQISGADLALNMYNQAVALGAQYIYGNVVNISMKHGYHVAFLDNGVNYFGKACIIATGITNKKLNIPGEDQYNRKGISYCAICDGTLTKDKIVAVVGNNCEALDDVLYLSSIATQVYLINKDKELPSCLESEGIKNNAKIKILNDTTCTQIKGDDNKVTELVVTTAGKTNSFKVEYVFINDGSKGNDSFIDNLSITDEEGNITVDQDKMTKIKGLYAIGDISKNRNRQITTATSDGTIASLSAIKYIKETFK